MDTDQTSTTDPMMLTADELAVLNAARAVCKGYAERIGALRFKHTHEWRQGTSPYDVGRVTGEAVQAEEHLFSFISASHIYLSYELTNEQLHSPEHYTPTGRTIPGDLRLVPAV